MPDCRCGSKIAQASKDLRAKAPDLSRLERVESRANASLIIVIPIIEISMTRLDFLANTTVQPLGLQPFCKLCSYLHLSLTSTQSV